MRALVTGGTGFLGAALSRHLASQGTSVLALGSRQADLTNARSLDAFSGERFDVIYHLAAWTQAGDFCLYHPGEQWIINQQINTTVLSWWQATQPSAMLVTIGTSCSYDAALPLTEDNYLVGTPIDSLFTYAFTKRMLFVGQLALRKQFGLRSLCVVPSTLYGPGYLAEGRQMHFIFDLIRKIIRGKRHGEPVILWGDGFQRREIIFVDDFVAALQGLLGRTDEMLVNIGAGSELTIRDYAAMISEHVEFDFGRIQFDTSRYVGAESKCLDITRLNRILPARPQTPLREGLRRTIDWFLSASGAVAAT